MTSWLEPFGDVPPDFTVEQVEEIRHAEEAGVPTPEGDER